MDTESKEEHQQETFSLIMSQTNLMRDEAFLTDFKLVCEDKEFLVHKLILSAVSPYFKQYFRTFSDETTLQLDFLNSTTLETILKFIYEGYVDVTKESLALLVDLVVASKIFQITFIYSHCSQLIEKRFTPKTLLSEWIAIENSKNDELKQIFLQHFHRHIGILKNSRSFLNLTFKQLSSLLNCSYYTVADHKLILSAILLWVKYDQPKRKKKITSLLESIDFGKISKSELQKFSNRPLLKKNLYFKEHTADVFLHGGAPNNSSRHSESADSSDSIQKLETKPVIPTQIKNSTTTISHTQNEPGPDLKKKQEYSSPQNKRSHLESEENCQEVNCLQNKRQKVNDLHEKCLLCYNQQWFQQVFEYHHSSKTWMNVNNQFLIQAISEIKWPAICSFDHYIYFFGGIIDHRKQPLRKCRLFDLKKNQLLEIPPMNKCRIGAKAVKINDTIYILGGLPSTMKTISITFERFSLRTQLWETLPTLLSQDYNPSKVLVTNVDGHLCLVGRTRLFWYNPESNAWLKGTWLPEESANTADFVIHKDKKIFILKFIEKASDCRADLHIFCFNLINNTWDKSIIPSAELADSTDTASVFEEGKFFLEFKEKYYLFTPPNSFHHFPIYQVRNPGLIIIGK